VRHRTQRGVTLVELLIAITLVAALSVTMLMAIRTSLITLEKVDARLQSNRRVVSVEQILARQIGGVMPVMGDCSNGTPAPDRVPVFVGNQQTLHLISTYSMSEGSRGSPRVLGLQVIPADDGGVRLIVNESPYIGPSSTAPFCASHQFFLVQPNPQSFILADRLAYCRILYHESIPDTPVGGNWVPLWNQANLPSAVRVEMAPLVPDPARLPLVGVTIPIHINREVLGQYVDTP
jgi:general secretion pathway protein J